MPKIKIYHNPELTQDELMQSMKDYYKGKYEVYYSKITNRFFVVKHSNYIGASVRLIQKKNDTIIKYDKFSPSAIARMFFGAFILLFSGGAVIKDISDYITKNFT